jgi:hypothetical protein
MGDSHDTQMMVAWAERGRSSLDARRLLLQTAQR